MPRYGRKSALFERSGAVGGLAIALAALACGERARSNDTAVEAAAPAQSAQFRDLIGAPFDAKVVRVADGDTLEAIPTGEQRAIRIRLEGVDAPELGEPFSREAMAFVRALLFDHAVRVRGRELDRYGRLVARVSAAGKDASSELVRAGLACHAYARDAALANDEARARSARAGFWGAATQPGCVTRTAFSALPGADPPRGSGERATEAPRTAIAAPFRGNVSSRVYHAASCPNFNCRNCTQVFASEADAQAAGFRPAGDCAGR